MADVDLEDLVGRLSGAVAQGRAIEMALVGSSSLEEEESEALTRLASRLTGELRGLLNDACEQLRAQHQKKPGGAQ